MLRLALCGWSLRWLCGEALGAVAGTNRRGGWGLGGEVAPEKEDQGHHLRVRLELVEEFCSRKPWHLHTFTNYIYRHPEAVSERC